jgi:hypothetical protein
VERGMSEQSDDPPTGFTFPDEYAAAIAEVTSYWAALEYNIDMSIWHLAGVYPAIGACVTAQIYTLHGRLKALEALAKLRLANKKLIDKINKFDESVRTPLDIRNRITHNCWFRNKEGSMSQLELGAKGVLTYGFKPILIDSLKKDCGKVRHAMLKATKLRDLIEDALPTLPEIPLKELHPTVLHSPGHEQTRSIYNTFLLFPPKPSQA